MTLRFGILLALCVLLVGGQRIAEKKCSEYREYTILRAEMIPLTIKPKPLVVERFDCSTNVDLIVGGEAAKPGEFPHHALLGFRKSRESEEIDFRCGGSLISEQFVLTAAHCMKHGNPITVRLGANNLADEFDNYSDFGVGEVVRHGSYHGSKSYHDIALVKLNRKVQISKFIRPACLWTDSKINVTSVIATGFGTMEYGGTKSKIMQKVSLDFLNTSECSDQFSIQKQKFDRGIADEQLCIGSRTGGKDTCQGDSGGPVQTVVESNGCNYHIIGVTSTGGVCGKGRSPSIYTKVSSYIKWIEQQVWPTRTWGFY